jgi:hypothetical protein
MSCWIIPSHFGSGNLPDPDGFSLPCRSLRSRFLVVPERESDRALGVHVRTAEDARHFHHQRGAGPIVVRRFAPAVAVHVAADDVHLLGVSGADLGAVHHLARPRRRRLHVERAKLFVRLLHRVRVHAGRRLHASGPAATLRKTGIAATASTGRARRRRVVGVRDPSGRAPVALELRFDPVNRRAIAIRALAPIAELRQAFDRGFVSLQIEPPHQRGDRIGWFDLCKRRGRDASNEATQQDCVSV